MAGSESYQWYDDNAAHFAEWNPESPIRKWVEWPGVRSLLPKLAGNRVVDAGCGDGAFTRHLARRGADVLGIDASRELLAIAEEELGDEVEFRRADLREPLGFVDDESVDVVVSQLVLDHIEDWRPVFEEFYRIIVPGGCIVLSVSNPPAVWGKLEFDTEGQFELDEPSYFEIERWSADWGASTGDARGRVQKYRRPLTVQLGTAFDAGFVLERLVEPTPTEEFQRAKPETYARWIRRPSTFICYRFRKPGASYRIGERGADS